MTPALTLCLAALALLALLALAFSRWPLWTRALIVVGVAVLWFVADDFTHRMWGWPSPGAVPERFVLLATVIDEPRKGSDGALYVWVNALEEGRALPQPRAYRLPYSKELHARLDSSMRHSREGIRQIGTAQRAAGRGASWLLRPNGSGQELRLRDLPVPELPEK